MEPLEIAERIREVFPEEVLAVSEFRGQVSVTLRKTRIRDVSRYLHDDPELYFDYLIDVCGVDLPWQKGEAVRGCLSSLFDKTPSHDTVEGGGG